MKNIPCADNWNMGSKGPLSAREPRVWNGGGLVRLISACLVGCALFLMLHFETTSIGSIKVSQLWKGGLLFVLILYLLSKSGGKINAYVYLPLILLAFLQLISYEMYSNPKEQLATFVQALLFPVIAISLMALPTVKAQRLLYFLSVFFVLSFIPYELGLVKSLGRELGMGAFGAADIFANIGPFQTPHGASTTLAMSFLVLAYFWLAGTYGRITITVLLIVCFYFLLKTFVRTGMVMAAVGLVPLFLHFVLKTPAAAIRGFVLVMLVGGLATIAVSTNRVLVDKVLGNRVHSTEDNIESVGSGRGRMFIASTNIFSDFTATEVAIGVGITEQKKRMELAIGEALFPHNGILYLLLVNGVAGVILFCWFVMKLWRRLRSSRTGQAALAKACFFAYLVMTAFQSYDLIYPFVILAVSVSYCLRGGVSNQKLQSS